MHKKLLHCLTGLLASVFFVSLDALGNTEPPAEDSKVTWLKNHAISLRSINQEDEDFKDLDPLRAAIGDAPLLC